jgi:hypothetical protein
MNSPVPDKLLRHRPVADRLDYLLTLQRDSIRGEALPLLLAVR